MKIQFINPTNPSISHLTADDGGTDMRLIDLFCGEEDAAKRVAIFDAADAAIAEVLAAKDAAAQQAALAEKEKTDNALETIKADAALINTTNRERITQLESQLAEAVQAVTAANAERDAQIARTQQIAVAAFDLEVAESLLNAQWDELRAKRQSLVATANQGRKEQLAAQLAAEEAALVERKKAAGLA